MSQLLSYKYDASEFRKADPIYEMTTGQHGDIEYLYTFEFDRSMPHFVKVQVFSIGWGENKNNPLSYWPYFAPESCISFKRDLMLNFLTLIHQLVL